MAHNEIDVAAPPERVFDVLSDPRAYARWVVGSKRIRRADAHFPAPGSAFDHAIGFGPLQLKDHSAVQQCERPRLLRLLVQARPFTRAHVTLRLHPSPAGTRVEMDEGPADGRSRLFMNALTDPLVRLRNHESLRRLKALAERREPIPAGTLPDRGDAAEAAVEGSSRPAAG
ncbi:SRPBCC family protein [Conexibacter sp. JD483]|uniref:SRPBCC family protein n=1 Tax=unclassified Conexibacter TaxID=2627773 RepID=UPI00271BC143|nr:MULTISPECIES: SRPBCC family protein [unclassified Conexibacter]MDO8184903.1 SRPBCC family protein [Conexibacter sp. CPCC 205706]MDO8198047.1 SRPBCC family protein [Conexibacter sp. CPCC 205762]MDR9372034.1 SRPBCC family protein [Conexibacter sp. JD483]